MYAYLYKPSKKRSNSLWINLRSKHEKRFNPKIIKYTSIVASSILKNRRIEEVVFDGLTDVGEFDMDLPRWNELISDSNRMSESLKADLEKVSSQCIYTNIIGASLERKLKLIPKAKYIIAPHGSGTWSSTFSDNAKAYIFSNEHVKSLRFDPLYDFTKFESSTVKYPINVSTSSADSIKRLIDLTC